MMWLPAIPKVLLAYSITKRQIPEHCCVYPGKASRDSSWPACASLTPCVLQLDL